MPRTVPEWIGKTDNSAIPPRVKLRIYEKAGGKCAACGMKVLPAEYDHIEPLIAGGENREQNIQLLCRPCHQAKTADDVAEKSAVATKAKKHIGIKKRSSFQNGRDGRWKTRLTSQGPRTELRR